MIVECAWHQTNGDVWVCVCVCSLFIASCEFRMIFGAANRLVRAVGTFPISNIIAYTRMDRRRCFNLRFNKSHKFSHFNDLCAFRLWVLSRFKTTSV